MFVEKSKVTQGRKSGTRLNISSTGSLIIENKGLRVGGRSDTRSRPRQTTNKINDGGGNGLEMT